MKTLESFNKKEIFKEGFTDISFLATIYSIAVFIPATIYLTLMTGSASLPVPWFTLILFSQIGRLTGRPLTKQEGFMIFMLAGWASYNSLGWIYSAWFRNSDIASFFNLANEIPPWVAPPPETGIFIYLRTLVHPSWIPPIMLGLLSSIFGALITFSLSIFAREIFIEEERLPFPLQKISAQTIIAITEGNRFSVNLLSICSLIGFVYGFIVYALPFILQSWTGEIIRFVPIPWVDLNRAVQDFLPGACLGIATDIAVFASALVLPFWTIISICMGSFGIYFLGNWIITQYDLSPIRWWTRNMSLELALQRSILYFWATPIIGIGLASGLLPLFRHYRVILKAVKPLIQPTYTKGRLTDWASPKKWVFIPLIIGVIGWLILFAFFVPEFIITCPWIVLAMTLMPFLWTLIDSRMLGETGVIISSSVGPNLNNILLYMSGYKGVNVWFFPTISSVSGGGYVGVWEIARLTETKITDYIKAWWITYPIAFILSLFYTEIFWRIAPIPSARYPGVQIFWPISATYQALWIRGEMRGLFNILWVLYAFIIGGILYAFTELTHIPLSFIGLAAGVATYTPAATTYLFGAFVARILERLRGIEWWNENKNLIAGGLVVGESVAIAVGIAVTLIINSLSILPY